MKITPKSEAQIIEESLVPVGLYDFEVVEAADTTSSNGNEMIVLIHHIYSEAGKKYSIKDYLLESFAFKLRHACDACGILNIYESGNLIADDFLGKTGKLEIKHGPDSRDKAVTQASVKDYVKRSSALYGGAAPVGYVKPQAAKEIDPFDDEIPF